MNDELITLALSRKDLRLLHSLLDVERIHILRILWGHPTSTTYADHVNTLLQELADIIYT